MAVIVFRDDRAWRLCGLLAVPYSLSWLLIQTTTGNVAAPSSFLLWIAGVGLPYSYCLLRGMLYMQFLVGHRPALGRVLAVACGLGSVWLLPPVGRYPCLWLLLCCTLLAIDWKRGVAHRLRPRSVAGNLLALSIALGVVCNLNYLLAPISAHALHDSALMHSDVAIYGWLFGHPVAYKGLFPLTRSPLALRLLENAYQMLFVEMLTVLLALTLLGREPSTFTRAISLCYLTGLIVFFIYPSTGPSIYYFDAFRPASYSPATYALMRSIALEFHAALARQASNGFAYFIAMPSLHAAIAVVCQCFLVPWRCLFWSLLPVNALVLASTVMLGYHYLVDIPAGVLVALAAVHVVGAKASRHAAIFSASFSAASSLPRPARTPEAPAGVGLGRCDNWT